jgi:plasmid stabilization system protein ParE
MPRVVVSLDAQRDLRQLAATRNLPTDTLDRVRALIQPLREFPDLGPSLRRPFDGRRFLLGPWRWMVIVYRHYPEMDLLAIVSVVDARTSSSPLADR